MTELRYLVDTSVLQRARQEVVASRIEALYEGGRLWTCRVIDLEVAYGAMDRDVPRVVAHRRHLPEAPLSPSVGDRALEVAGMLAASGRHRHAKPTDLLIAAAAEAAGLAVLHYDRDFERIASVTTQHCEWVAAPGTLDGQAD